MAAEQVARAAEDVRGALVRELEAARYDAELAGRRYEHVDPAKRHVARELEARWNAALERVAGLEHRIAVSKAEATTSPGLDRAALMRLAHDLPAAWNAPTTDAGTKQRLAHVLIREVVIDLDAATNEAVLVVHWTGGRHTELRVARVRTGRYPTDRNSNAVEVLRKLGGRWPDRELAVTLNRMRCRTPDGQSWTMVRVRDLRERLGIAACDATASQEASISVDATARHLGICVSSVHRLIRDGVLPATQVMPSAPWEVPVAALTTEAVLISVRGVVARRPKNFERLQDLGTLRLPGI